MLYLDVEKLTIKYNALWNNPDLNVKEKQRLIASYHKEIKDLKEEQYNEL